MTPQSVQRFIGALTKLAAVFRIEADDVLIEAYWDALRDWPIEALEAGAQAIIASARFFPRPVEWADAAEDWLKERQVNERTRRLAVAQSNEPPLRAEEVKALVADLSAKMGWPIEANRPTGRA